MSVAIYAAYRVEDLPEPGVDSDRGVCERCRASVWVDPVGFQSVKRMEDEELLVCLRCAIEVLPPDSKFTVTPEQGELIRRHLRGGR